MSLKFFLAGIGVLAVAAGLMIPVPHGGKPPARSQIETMSVSR